MNNPHFAAAQALKQRLEAGGKANPFWICGPCVIEDRTILAQVAERLKLISEKYSIPVVFKASSTKRIELRWRVFAATGWKKA